MQQEEKLVAHADWKRYYCVVYDKPPAYQPVIFKERQAALIMLYSERFACRGLSYQPVGIVSLRGNKRNPQLQKWLLEHSR